MVLHINHFEAMLLFAGVVSAAFAFLNKRQPLERLKYFALAFLAFVLVALALGWLMFPFTH